MLERFFKGVLDNPIYVRIYTNRLRIRHLISKSEVELHAPQSFTTRRLLVGELSLAKTLLRKGLRKNPWKPAPVILVHPVEMVEGGLSEVEERVLRELVLGAGARKALIWVGHELSDSEASAHFK